MNRPTFALEPLLNFRKNRRDLCRQLLAQILSDDASLAAERRRLLANRDLQLRQFRQIGRRGRVAVDEAAMRRYHSSQLMAQVRIVDEQRQLVAQQLQLCRETLTRADAEVKALERLKEKRLAEYAYRSERRAQHELEDAWTASRILESSR